MNDHKVVTKEEWIAAREEHLKKEKKFTKLRDELSAQRRELPWVQVTESYMFDGPQNNKQQSASLSDLFGDKSQLLVYHFMFDPEWEMGCKSCSYLADHFDRSIVHLKQRDVNMVAISRAPLEKLHAYRDKMGWSFPWLSSEKNNFNYDYNVSFREEEKKSGEVYYNYGMAKYFSSEGPGISVFYKDNNDVDGKIYHTYSSYGRGLDMFISAYHLLDICPKGRNEGDLPYTMAWLKRSFEYKEQEEESAASKKQKAVSSTSS